MGNTPEFKMLTQVRVAEVRGGYRKREPLLDRFRAATVGVDAGSRAVCTATGLFVGFRMTNHPSRHRINFRDVAVGQRFYDPISEVYLAKQSATMAAMVTGIGYGTVPDAFEADEVVGIDH